MSGHFKTINFTVKIYTEYADKIEPKVMEIIRKANNDILKFLTTRTKITYEEFTRWYPDE